MITEEHGRPATERAAERVLVELLQLERDGADWRPVLRNGQPILVDPASVPGYAAQIGDNTKYIIHPEEILADNFVFLLDGRIDLPTPRVVEAMGNVLQGEPVK